MAACSSTPVAPDERPSRERADAEFIEGRFGQAEREYDKILLKAPAAERGPLLLMLGKCRLGKGDATGALGAFDEAIASSSPEPVRIEALYRRGIAHNVLWKPERALLDFRRVLEAPKESRESAVKSDELLFRVGVTCLRAGMAEEGRRHLGRLLKEFPDSTEAAEARERLALKAIHLQIARCPNEVTADRRASEARTKGLSAEILPSAASPSERLVVVGRFTRFEDALRELSRIRVMGYADAFPIP
jgi:tetratricopeptide (TPR) repeat protein